MVEMPYRGIATRGKLQLHSFQPKLKCPIEGLRLWNELWRLFLDSLVEMPYRGIATIVKRKEIFYPARVEMPYRGIATWGNLHVFS